jgi:hypothetical protein
MGMDTTWGSMGGAGSMGNMNNNSGKLENQRFCRESDEMRDNL